MIGANGERDTRIVVVGEGVWSVENGVVTFIPEEGYNGTPTPIRYTIVNVDRRDNVDGDGSSSNEANISIKGECVCKEYKSDISSLGLSGILLLSTLLFVVGGFLFREEESLAL